MVNNGHKKNPAKFKDKHRIYFIIQQSDKNKSKHFTFC